MFVYPRLETSTAVQLLGELTELSHTETKRRASTQDPRATWYPTAVERVSDAQLTELQTMVRTTAERFGFPEAAPQRNPRFTQFDQAVSVDLLRGMQIVPADAAHDGVWAFLTLVLLPDVAFWRFPNRRRREDYERLLGRPRNVFRRLWWRAYVMGEQASLSLLEDEAVAIMERPTIGGNPRLASAVAGAHLRAIAGGVPVSRTELLRQASKRLRRLSAVVTLGTLSNEEVGRLLDEIFESAADALALRH